MECHSQKKSHRLLLLLLGYKQELGLHLLLSLLIFLVEKHLRIQKQLLVPPPLLSFVISIWLFCFPLSHLSFSSSSKLGEKSITSSNSITGGWCNVTRGRWRFHGLFIVKVHIYCLFPGVSCFVIVWDHRTRQSDFFCATRVLEISKLYGPSKQLATKLLFLLVYIQEGRLPITFQSKKNMS